jgi:hypothetical protein
MHVVYILESRNGKLRTSIVSIHCKVQLSCGGKRQQHAQDRAVAITMHRNVMTCPFHIIVCPKVYLGMKK